MKEAEERTKWRPIDDYEPLRPWLGPKNAEFFKLPEDLRDYGASVPFSEVKIVNEVSEVSAYWYLRGKLHFGRTDDKPEEAGISFRPTWTRGVPGANSPPAAAADLCPRLHNILVKPTEHLRPEEMNQGGKQNHVSAAIQAQATLPLSFTGDPGTLDWDCEPNDPAEAVGAQGTHSDSSVLGPCSSRPFSQR